ncbi:MAG: DNA ligase LigA-related protein, partial [Bacteroidota bacterium]
MSKENIHERIEKLRKEIDTHNYKYYVLSQPEISDYEYDMMIKELERLESENPEFADPNSPTRRVGDDRNREFEEAEHEYPMLSLGNTYSENEMKEFDKRVR